MKSTTLKLFSVAISALVLGACGQYEAEDPSTVISTWKNTSFCAITSEFACLEGVSTTLTAEACVSLGGEVVGRCPATYLTTCAGNVGGNEVAVHFYEGVEDLSKLCPSSISSSSQELSSSSDAVSSSSIEYLSSSSMVANVIGSIWSKGNYGMAGPLSVVHPIYPAGVKGGSWFKATDSGDGGGSTATFSLLEESSYSAIDAKITTAAGFDYPFGLIAFHLSDSKLAVNLEGIAGLCIVYKAENSLILQLSGEYPPSIEYPGTNFDYYSASIPSKPEMTLLEIPITSFKQGGWGAPVQIEDVLANYVSNISFRYNAIAGKQNSFQIYAVGLSGTCKIQ